VKGIKVENRSFVRFLAGFKFLKKRLHFLCFLGIFALQKLFEKKR
jgi:hypothetical protein